MIAIRLKKMGTKGRNQWRVVVADSRTSRASRVIEEIGSYNPTVEPPEVRVQMERYTEWVRKGAQPSETVRALIRKVKGA